MSKREVYILCGVAAAVLAVGYLATKREVNATVTEGVASITYRAGGGGNAPAPSAQEDSHQRMLELIEESNAAIAADDAETLDATKVVQ